jgi:hypothetical protein
MLRSAVAQQDALPGVDQNVVESPAFAQVLEEVRQRRNEFDSLSHVPRDMIERFKQVGIYRAATPKCYGGDALAPAKFLQMIERISEADGSAGWVASFGSAGVYLAALPPETLAEIYADSPDLVFAGGLFPLQPAEAVEGGWQVNGTWKFASGCKGADLLGVGIGAAGGSRAPPYSVRIRSKSSKTGTWSASKAPAAMTCAWPTSALMSAGPSSVAAPRPSTNRCSATHRLPMPRKYWRWSTWAWPVPPSTKSAAWPAAVASPARQNWPTALMYASRSPRPKPNSAPRAVFLRRHRTGLALDPGGNPVTPEQTSLLRLSAIHVSQAGADVVQSAYSLAGTTAIYLRHPLQRYLRDSMVVTQHAFLSEGLYDGAGSVSSACRRSRATSDPFSEPPFQGSKPMTQTTQEPLRVVFCIGITQNFFDLPTGEGLSVWKGFSQMMGPRRHARHHRARRHGRRSLDGRPVHHLALDRVHHGRRRLPPVGDRRLQPVPHHTGRRVQPVALRQVEARIGRPLTIPDAARV